MSAATEALVEQITQIESSILVTESQGKDASALKAELRSLQRRLHVYSDALNENKQVLKS